ncbi:FusB/FusC family EF-G-binding protein [Macrococcoides bohemicum]|uniref:FusB/FusC family EF-G-binding protein n=1 Tax=Macrococcoides bohemicum TaxID=1903056 RepID=UPI003B002827
MIKSYEFAQVMNNVNQLLKIYKTNDPTTNKAQKNIILDEIRAIYIVNGIDASESITKLDDIRLSKTKAAMILSEMKQFVEPFEMPSAKQVEKLFKKVKKLNTPPSDQYDLQMMSYLGWNDHSANRKYIVFKDDKGAFQSVYGELAPTKVKGFCSICQHESDVSLFLNKTKANSDGTYTKKGDYICHDSNVCNQHLDDIDKLYHFIQKIK